MIAETKHSTENIMGERGRQPHDWWNETQH
jgi:hypothetical protein